MSASSKTFGTQANGKPFPSWRRTGSHGWWARSWPGSATPAPLMHSTRRWRAQEPLLAGERITLGLSDDGPQREAVVLQPGRTGGCARNDVVELEWVAAATGRTPEEPVTRMSALTLAGCVHRAEWSDERLRQAELERQWPEPPASYPLDCHGISPGATGCGAARSADRKGRRRRARAWGPDGRADRAGGARYNGGEDEAEDHCTLRELWRSDYEPCQEFSLLARPTHRVARWRAFCGNEDERWSKTQAQEKGARPETGHTATAWDRTVSCAAKMTRGRHIPCNRSGFR